MTTNGQLALIHFSLPFFPQLPLSPGALGQDDQQQLLWQYPDILWGEPAPEPEPTPAPVAAGGGGIDIANFMRLAKVLDAKRKRKRRIKRAFLLG